MMNLIKFSNKVMIINNFLKKKYYFIVDCKISKAAPGDNLWFERQKINDMMINHQIITHTMIYRRHCLIGDFVIVVNLKKKSTSSRTTL